MFNESDELLADALLGMIDNIPPSLVEEAGNTVGAMLRETHGLTAIMATFVIDGTDYDVFFTPEEFFRIVLEQIAGHLGFRADAQSS